MRVLVTGAAGLIGIHVVDLLVRRPDVSVVFGVDDFSRSYLKNSPFIRSDQFEKKFELMKCDYKEIDVALLDKLEPHVVIHLAASVSIPESLEKPWLYFLNNEFGTFDLLQKLLKTKNQPALIFASSPEVYGVPKYVPMDEEHPLNPRSIYSVTKLACEKHCLALYQWYGYPVTIIRNFNTYGENQNLGAYAGVITAFISNALRNEPIFIHGDGTQTRDFLYVEDNARAYSMLVDKVDSAKGEVFNIGTGKETSINELAKKIIALRDTKSIIVHMPNPRTADLPALCADFSKIKEKLGWEPLFTLEEGLRRTMSWYKSALRGEMRQPTATQI